MGVKLQCTLRSVILLPIGFFVLVVLEGTVSVHNYPGQYADLETFTKDRVLSSCLCQAGLSLQISNIWVMSPVLY